jgi:hypothetical protein
MIFRHLKQKFRRHFTDEHGKPILGTWIDDRYEAVLLDADSGKVLAFVSQDGDDEYYAIVYVSPLRALHLSWYNDGFLVSLLPLPRCAVKLLTLGSMETAKSYAELALQGRL